MRRETTRPVDLAAVAALAIAAPALALALPDGSPLRVALGLPFLLVAPGYALVAALFPERSRRFVARKGEEGEVEEEVHVGLEPLERAGLSLGLSIAVVPLLGLGLNATPWGIRLVPILLAVGAFTLLASGVAYVRRAALPADERPLFAVQVDAAAWRASSGLDKTLTVLLGVSVIAAAGALAYVLATPRPAERFTEFYILGPGGKAEGYPSAMSPGGNATILVGIVNQEGGTVEYRWEAVWIEGRLVGEVNQTFEAAGEQAYREGVVLLAAGSQDERALDLIAPAKPGDWKLELRLRKGDAPDVYRRLHFYVTVA